MSENRTEVYEFLNESNAIEGVYDSASLDQAFVAWDWLMEEKEMTTHAVLRTHKYLMLNQPGLGPNEKGYLRTVPVFIGGKEAMNAISIPYALDEWCNAMNLLGNDDESASRRLHVEYEKIHPFVDGNGRTGRMFMNWWRIRNGMPILTIHAGDEQVEYYKWFQER